MLDSQDEHLAHWVGICNLEKDEKSQEHILTNISAQWWLDESALADLYWACLISLPGRGAVVVDLDGTEHAFAGYEAAVTWLREDEYEPILQLVERNEIASDVLPPAQMIALALHVSGNLNGGYKGQKSTHKI